MPGTFIVRPIEANLTHNTDLIGKMNPYCSVVVGNTRIKGQICKKGGKHPHWNDAITVPATGESKVLVELMDKDKITHDDLVGSFVLDLNEIQSSGQVSRWYPLTYKNKAAGEILLETVYQPEGGLSSMSGQNQYYGQQEQQLGAGAISGQTYGQEQVLGAGAISGGQTQVFQQEVIAQPVVVEETVTTTTTATVQPVIQQEVVVEAPRHVWTEQRQSVEAHTFMKEVDVVETRSVLKDIEVMEPVKVLKEVQYTQAVPVVKQIEVVEPQVVTKEIEVIEPMLVTKTIQVVENVPVRRQVEVVEMRNAIQEVETFEPQTFTKQVEVTEFMPATRQVEVTQPVTVKKAVEYVEPVITTQYITKEMQQPVIIDQKITTEVGPASVIGWTNEYIVQEFGSLTRADSTRLGGHQRWVGYETIFTGLTEQERLWEQQRLSRMSEQEWLAERQRLMGFSEKDRLVHQRSLFEKIKSALGFGSGHTQQNMGTGSMMHQGIGHTSNYHASPNF